MPDHLIVTGWTVLANGALFLALTLSVIRLRRAERIVLGDGENRDMMKRVRGHANAAEQMPVFLIALALAESLGAHPGALASTAAVFTLGRMAHGLYFHRKGTHWRFRVWGMFATLAAQGAILILLGLALALAG